MERPVISEEALLRAVRRYFRPSDGAYYALDEALGTTEDETRFGEAVYGALCAFDFVQQKEAEVRELLAAYNRGGYD